MTWSRCGLTGFGADSAAAVSGTVRSSSIVGIGGVLPNSIILNLMHSDAQVATYRSCRPIGKTQDPQSFIL